MHAKMISSSGSVSGGIVKWALILLTILILTGPESSMSATLDGTNKENSYPEPPLLFPEDTSQYRIITNNTTILRKLVYSTNNNSEILDMLKPAQNKLKELDKKYDNVREIMSDVETEKRSSLQEGSVVNHENPKLETEILQKMGASVDQDAPKGSEEDQISGKGRWAAMGAAILLTSAAVAYIGMVLWRKTLERKYGSRQMLTDEDDTPNRMKHSQV